MTIGQRGILVLALCVFAACAHKKSIQRGYPAPAGDELLRAISARQSAILGADLETRTTSWIGGDRTRASVFMLVDRIGRLRFDAEVSLQGTVATLVTDGQTFSLLDLQSQVFERGPACPRNIARLIPVPLHPREISAILLGDAPLAAGAHVVTTRWNERQGTEVLQIANPAGQSPVTRNLWVSLKRSGSETEPTWRIEAVEAGEKSGARWRVMFDGFESDDAAPGMLLPSRIQIAEPGKSFDDGVEIKIRDRKLNPTFREKAFSLVVPEGMQVQTMACCDQCQAPSPSTP